MQWKSLVSTQNLKLAWRRINTGRNIPYKRFYRDFYLVYESAAEDNIRELHKQLVAKAWNPNHVQRVYLPKPSGLQRPISLLGIEDQILLQAVSNVFAKKLCEQRERVELDTVFSNKLAKPASSIFFTERWQTTYRAFQEKCVELFSQGYRWAAHFDLSAYYDTISHDLLVRIVSPKESHPETWNIVKKWFQTWSAGDSSAMTGHGIPQGPIASDFLAEAFFLPIDLKLKKKGCPYVRYVDDIRLFGKTENQVRQTAIMLEQECRHRGLIPQSAKFEIRDLKSVKDAMGSLPSIPPSDGKGASETGMTASEAMEVLKTAISGRPSKVRDKSRFRYVMYRAPADTGFLKVILRLLPRHPEHIDAFVAYFANFGKRRKIAKDAITHLESGLPYTYVRGELWHLIARLGSIDELDYALPMARSDAKRRSDCVLLSWGVMHFFMRCAEEGLVSVQRMLSSECPMSRALLAPKFADQEFTKKGHVIKLLKGTVEEQLAAARQMQKRKVSLNSIGTRQRDLSPLCRNSLRALGIIRRCDRSKIDWVSVKLASLYGCTEVDVWRGLLIGEYEHASQILIEAEVRFPCAYSEWLSLQDSFNDIMIRQFFGYLDSRGLPGHFKTVARDGKLVKYGSLISQGSPFDTEFKNVATKLRQLHKRRNQLPGSHPYDEKGGTKNRWLTSKKERNTLVSALKMCLNEIIAVVKDHGI